MQDKETVDDAEEALTCKADAISDRQAPSTPTEKKESISSTSSKESSKDGKFQFRKMKTPKKEKVDKNSPSKYAGDGVVFKAKLIGLESVADARGDKMCQDAMQRLKLGVKGSGQHKKKIHISVSLQGIKIKDEKSGVAIYHHPVSLISFISQDITDARAFGYVFGSTSEPHQFIAIKTEKPAFHVVLALRDLFQTVLNFKQEEIENVKTSEGSKADKKEFASENTDAGKVLSAPNVEESQAKDDNIYIELLLTEPFKIPEDFDRHEYDTERAQGHKEPATTVDDLLGLQSEMNKLQEGINQMDTSIAAAAAFNAEIPTVESDPFDTSFVLGPKRDSIPFPMPIPVPASVSANPMDNLGEGGDKYAAFNAIDSGPSIFESPDQPTAEQISSDLRELEEEIARKTVAPAKPPRISKSASPDLSLFADLDPLGKDRPYKDKTEFFQDVKNPPKKVLNDLVDPTKETGRNIDFGVLSSSSVPFPVDFESVSPPTLVNPHHSSNGVSKVSQPLTVNCNLNGSHTSTSPIPIPLAKDRSFSNGSPYSKSPQTFGTESPNQMDYYISNYNNSEGSSPTGLKNGHHGIYLNGENGHLTKQNLNSFLNSSSNGVSRPRPRPSLNKGGSVPNGGRTVSSHSLSSDSSSDYEVISRENMQSIANVLLTNGHRLRAQSLCLETNNEFKLKLPGETNGNIFAKKSDPFADDFFFAVPKKNGHLSSTEIPECV